MIEGELIEGGIDRGCIDGGVSQQHVEQASGFGALSAALSPDVFPHISSTEVLPKISRGHKRLDIPSAIRFGETALSRSGSSIPVTSRCDTIVE